MVSDLRNRHQIEQFLLNASADELIEQLDYLRSLPAPSPAAIGGDANGLIARIAYELRFRLPQPI